MVYGVVVFFFNDTATAEIYTLSLHDALPISGVARRVEEVRVSGRRVARAREPPLQERRARRQREERRPRRQDRKSTRLNSSHANISYAVFCLKKKKKIRHLTIYSPSGTSMIQ